MSEHFKNEYRIIIGDTIVLAIYIFLLINAPDIKSFILTGALTIWRILAVGTLLKDVLRK